MGRITTADLNTAHEDDWPGFEDWPEPDEGAEVLEGDGASRGLVLPRADDTGNAPVVGTFARDSPSTMAMFHKEYETVHVLEGEVEITLDDGQKVHLAAGHIATLPKGHRTVSKFTKTPYRELFVIHG